MTANEKRSGEIKIRLNPAERAVIEGKATAMDLPIAVYLRQKGTGELVEEKSKKISELKAEKKTTVKPDILVRIPAKWADYMASEAKKRGFSLSLQVRLCVTGGLASLKLPLSEKSLDTIKKKVEGLEVIRGGRRKNAAERFKSIRMFLGPEITNTIRGISEEHGLFISDIIRALLKIWFENEGME